MLEWKYEPMSPSGTLPLGLDDDWLLFDDRLIGFSDDVAEPMYDLSDRALLGTRTLEEMENSEWEKEIKEGNVSFFFYLITQFTCTNIHKKN